jgi:hypothetical protein
MQPPGVDDGEVFVDDMGGFMAALVLLNDQGHCPNVSFGDDEDSQRFVGEVRKANQGWEPGRRPTVPAPLPLQVVKAPIVHVPERRELATPRERRARARRTGSRASPSDPSDPSDEPPPDLEHLRPLSSFARAYLRAEVDRRRREAVAARPEVRLFDEDGAA